MALIRKIKTKVTGIIEYSDDIRLYRLETSNKNFDFKCGQFLQLAVDEYDTSFPWPESRCFSIVSSPKDKDFIEILVSRKGKFTNRIFSELKPDDTVWIKLPYGDFNFDTGKKKELFFVAGGTGISPFISFLKLLTETEIRNRINLYYGVRENNLIIFSDLFEEIKSKYNNIKMCVYVENLIPSGNDKYIKGILPVSEITENIINCREAEVYLSGPPLMINSFNKALIEKDFSENNIHFDKWE